MNREKLLELAKPDLVTVQVDGVGEFHLRVMTGKERESYSALFAEKGPDDFREQLLVRALCDENGNRCLGDDEAALISTIKPMLLDALYAEAVKHNILDDASVKVIKKN